MDRIKVEFKSESPNSGYGYYERGDTGIVIGYTSGCAVVLKDDGSFVKAELSWIKEVKNIIPELSESEDDGIRKAISQCVEDMRGQFEKLYRVHHKDAIAWLEKQVDSPIKWNKNTEGNKPQINHSVLIKATHGIAEGEWKGGCWYLYRWSSRVSDSDVLSWMELSDLEKQGEQKPLEMITPEESLGVSSETYNKIVDECIYGEQKTVEWSEEDEEELKIALDTLEKAGQHSSATWLKNVCLVPQSQWKPSDEQMEALDFAADCIVPAEFCFKRKFLKELLEQLKKLREE